jgi:hypothetical protein
VKSKRGTQIEPEVETYTLRRRSLRTRKPLKKYSALDDDDSDFNEDAIEEDDEEEFVVEEKPKRRGTNITQNLH